MDKVSEMTDVRHCEACGQVKFPSDHWQRELAAQKEQFRVLTDEMLVMMDERNAAVLDAAENTEIANEFKHTMEEYRQREEAAYVESARLVKMLALADEQIKENVKALRVAVGLLSTMPQFSNMHPNDPVTWERKEQVKETMRQAGWMPIPKPLTQDQIDVLCDVYLWCQEESRESSGIYKLIREVERAHGIGEKDE